MAEYAIYSMGEEYRNESNPLHSYDATRICMCVLTYLKVIIIIIIYLYNLFTLFFLYYYGVLLSSNSSDDMIS